MPTKQNDFKILADLIKSQAENTETKLTKLIKSRAEDTETKLTKLFKSEIKFVEARLKDNLDIKFETNRRLLVDDMQNFQDAIITEVKNIKLETSVNSSHRNILTNREDRLTKVEKHLFSN